MKFKGNSTYAELNPETNVLTFELIDLEQIDAAIISDTDNGRIRIEKSGPTPLERTLKICCDYEVSISQISEEKTDPNDMLQVVKMSLDKGLGLIEYKFYKKGETVILTLPKGFDTKFEIGDKYFITWQKTN